MKIGDIITKSPFGADRKPKRFCERCGNSGPRIDWSYRVWMGEGEMLGVVAPCECASNHDGRWLNCGLSARRILSTVEMSGSFESIWKNEMMFPLPEPDCACEFCEIFSNTSATFLTQNGGRPEE